MIGMVWYGVYGTIHHTPISPLSNFILSPYPLFSFHIEEGYGTYCVWYVSGNTALFFSPTERRSTMAAEESSRGPDKVQRKGDKLASLLNSMGGGGDCDRPACDDTKTALSAALQRLGDQSGRGVASKSGRGTKQSNDKECPPTKDEIGRSTWSLLHSMAAWYPDSPTGKDQQLMSGFMRALAQFYPCSWCATDFQRNIELSPPKTETRDELCIWLCEQHNIVNKKLGKPLFQCTLDKLDERWRKSRDPKCQK